MAVAMPVVPLAAMGYVSADWHRLFALRVAEVVFGLVLAAVLALYVWPRGGAQQGGAAVNYTPSRRAVISQGLHGISLIALTLFSAAAFVGHGLGWFAYALR